MMPSQNRATRHHRYDIRLRSQTVFLSGATLLVES